MAEHVVSLPIFWPSQLGVWFAQAEAQFHLRKITADKTKYYYVLAALDHSTASCLLDLISPPPQDNKYKTLKDHLIDTFGLSKRERALEVTIRFQLQPTIHPKQPSSTFWALRVHQSAIWTKECCTTIPTFHGHCLSQFGFRF